MKNLNRLTLIGTLGSEPEVRRINDNGSMVAHVSMATNEYKRNQETGRYERYDTQWHSLVFWDRLAALAQQHLHKGMEIYVEGRLRYSKYRDKHGVEKEKAEISVSDVYLLNIHDYSVPKKTDSLTGLTDKNLSTSIQDEKKLLEGSVPDNQDDGFPF